MDRPIRIAFLSEHASPLVQLGGADAGGQNVYVGEVSRNLARHGYAVDVFTRRDSPDTPEITKWAPGVRVVNLLAGPVQPRPKDELAKLPARAEPCSLCPLSRRRCTARSAGDRAYAWRPAGRRMWLCGLRCDRPRLSRRFPTPPATHRTLGRSCPAGTV